MDTTKIIEKQFVTYEIAKLLKEIGFDEPCLAYYSHDSRYNHNNEIKLFMYGQPKEYEIFTSETFDDLEDGEYNAPLWQQVTDWLRDKKLIDILILPQSDSALSPLPLYFYAIESYINEEFKELYNSTNKKTLLHFSSYGEAREQAILNILKTLK